MIYIFNCLTAHLIITDQVLCCVCRFYKVWHTGSRFFVDVVNHTSNSVGVKVTNHISTNFRERISTVVRGLNKIERL